MTEAEDVSWNEASPPSGNLAKIEGLRARYLAGLAQRISELELLFERVSDTELHADEREALRQIAHKLAGNGATYGFSAISEIARGLEQLLTADSYPAVDLLARAVPEGMTPDELSSFDRLLEKCLKASAASGLEPVSTVLDVLAKRLQEPVPAPRQMVTAYLRQLIDASRTAIDRNRGRHPASNDLRDFAEVTLPQSPRRTVLIVDDDENVRAVIAAAIGAFADVIPCASARQAYVHMKRHRPDLVLLDDDMPGDATGMELLERIQGRSGVDNIPVVMISARCGEEQVAQARRCGAVDFIAKPFDPQEVSGRIKRRLYRLDKAILVVDDDPAVCNLLTGMLSALGFTVLEAWDGRLALDKLNLSHPDLVLLDWQLPGLSGEDLLREMKAAGLSGSIPVIVISAQQNTPHLQDELAIAEWITKPFALSEIAEKCALILDPANS